ncbi:NUDIX hydrolase [Urbifossiella limnaea]|uniref:NUDIX domain protein n=1 Tax=Urbifossiella limnaea TaxID=2528023 RepID=A0A517Y3D9_9BACT|nr:NUDIX hydrolase [Urbifossiella limnaea]QDU24257.1 NUDIX domain protein [Urbifossiella limnaea]
MSDPVRQSAVLAVSDDRVCLVTARSGRRWVIPKGQIDPGHTAGEAALIEAWEEAGLAGTLDGEPVGSFVYEKLGRAHHVLVYRMTVTAVHDRYPEMGSRQRAWVTVDEAIDRVDEPGLRDLLRRLFEAPHPDQLSVG